MSTKRTLVELLARKRDGHALIDGEIGRLITAFMDGSLADYQMALPTSQCRALREFGGQRFAHHIAADAPWSAWTWMGQATLLFEAQDTGISAATDGLASALVVRAKAADATTPIASHRGEFLFVFVLKGALRLKSATLGDHQLSAGDSVTIPSGVEASLRADAKAQFLAVALPGCNI